MGFMVIVTIRGGINILTQIRHIDQNGRINIPKKYLEILGIGHDEDIFIYCLQDRMVISKDYLPGLSGGELVITGRVSSRNPKKPVEKFEKSDKYNPKWAYEMREKGYSVLQMVDMIKEDIGVKPNRTTLTKWIKKYKESI